MSANIPSEHRADQLPQCLPVPNQQVLAYLRRHAGYFRAVVIGLVLAVGSCGLILGGFTVAVSSLLVRSGVGLLGAMTIGFFAIGFVGALLGVYIATRAIRELSGDL